jgi:prephenate dehydratase
MPTQPVTYAYLGPDGTFSHQAAKLASEQASQPAGQQDGQQPAPTPVLIQCPTITEVFDLVDRGKATYGVVPIENALEGSVNATLDAFAFTSGAQILRELVLDIHHNLVLAPGATLADATTVASHPQALAQCRRWLAQNLPRARTLATNSTAEAVKLAAGDKTVAAIGTAFAANLFGAVVAEEQIEDHYGNQTRFVVMGNEAAPRTERSKTSIALFMQEDRPGTLQMILEELAYAGLNLTKIESRPTKRALGDYMFWIDIDGHISDPHLRTALDCLRLKLREVKVIGSYPACG